MLSLLLLLAAPALAHLPYQLADGVEGFLTAPLDTSFSCEGRPYGYYADVPNSCQVFHVCLPLPEEGGLVRVAHFSFVCGNRTVFSQFSLTCSHPEDAFPCDQAESLYDAVNAEFGKRLEDGGRSEIVFPVDSEPAASAPGAAPSAAAAQASDAASAASASIDVDATLDAAAADDISVNLDADLAVEKSLDYGAVEKSLDYDAVEKSLDYGAVEKSLDYGAVEKSLDSDYPLVGEQSVAEDVEAPAEVSGYLPL